MNYQLLIESYSHGTSLSEQEIELLSLELETQIMNINISTEFSCFKSAPTHIWEGLNLKKDTYWIMCLAEILDLHKPPHLGKRKVWRFSIFFLKKDLLLVNYLSIKKNKLFFLCSDSINLRSDK